MRPTGLFWTSLHDTIFMSIHIHNFTLITMHSINQHKLLSNISRLVASLWLQAFHADILGILDYEHMQFRLVRLAFAQARKSLFFQNLKKKKGFFFLPFLKPFEFNGWFQFHTQKAFIEFRRYYFQQISLGKLISKHRKIKKLPSTS